MKVEALYTIVYDPDTIGLFDTHDCHIVVINDDGSRGHWRDGTFVQDDDALKTLEENGFVVERQNLLENRCMDGIHGELVEHYQFVKEQAHNDGEFVMFAQHIRVSGDTDKIDTVLKEFYELYYRTSN